MKQFQQDPLQNPRALLNLFFPGSFSNPLLLPIEKEKTAPDPELKSPGSSGVDDYLTADEAARYLNMHPQTFRKWVRLGVFPRIPLPGQGKDFRFSRKAIDEWAEKRTLGECDWKKSERRRIVAARLLFGT